MGAYALGRENILPETADTNLLRARREYSLAGVAVRQASHTN